MDAQRLGLWGERVAARYLEARGLILVDHHYQKKWGEVDLICKDGDTWVFVEVKTRSRAAALGAIDAVHPAKRDRVRRAAMSYFKWKQLEGAAFRFDLVLIEGNQILWIPDAFEGSTRYTY